MERTFGLQLTYRSAVGTVVVEVIRYHLSTIISTTIQKYSGTQVKV